MQAEEISKALGDLLENELEEAEAGKAILHQETQKRIEETENLPEGHTGWQNESPPEPLLSPDDEKNVRRIRKSPGGC